MADKLSPNPNETINITIPTRSAPAGSIDILLAEFLNALKIHQQEQQVIVSDESLKNIADDLIKMLVSPDGRYNKDLIQFIKDNNEKSNEKTAKSIKKYIDKKFENNKSAMNEAIDKLLDTKLKGFVERIQRIVDKGLDTEEVSIENQQVQQTTHNTTETTTVENASNNPTAEVENKVEERKEENTSQEKVVENPESQKDNDNQNVVNNVSSRNAMPIHEVSEAKVDTKVTQEDSKTKVDKRIKLVKKSIDHARMLSEPRMPWYKKIFRFANNHPVLATLAGGAIGLGLAALSGPLFYMHMGLASMINYFGITLASGLTLGLGGGVTVAGTANRVLKGKKGRLYAKFDKLYGQCASIDKVGAVLMSQMEKSKEKAQEYHQKAKETKGLFGCIKKKGYRFLRNMEMQKSKSFGILRAKSRKLYQEKVEKAVEAKADLNEMESKPNFRGKTKTMAVAGYMEKKNKLDRKLERGKIDPELYELKMEDMDSDVAKIKGGEPGLRKINPKQRTYDKEALQLINSIEKGRRSESMNAILSDIEERHTKTEVYEEDFIDPRQAKVELEEMSAEGRNEDAQELIEKIKEQENAIIEYKKWAKSKGVPEDIKIFDVPASEDKQKDEM